MRYIVVYMAISLLSLAYHCIGVYFFSPPKTSVTIDTAPPIVYSFDTSDIMAYVLDHGEYFITHVAHLKSLMELFMSGIWSVALEAILDHFEVSRKKRNMFYGASIAIGVIGVVLTFNTMLICILIIYWTAEALPHLDNRISRSLVVLCAIPFMVINGYCLPYLMGGVPITEYFGQNGMDISPYMELFGKFGIDISRVFVVGGEHTNNALSNLIGFRSMMAVMIGEHFLRSNIFEVHKGILLHEIGHGKHFDILYMNILPAIMALGAVYALTRRTTKKSVLEMSVTVDAKASLFFLTYTLTRNAVGQVCETRADDFARLHGSSAYLYKGILGISNSILEWYYPPFTPAFIRPSNYHRLTRDGSVEITHA